MKNKEFRKREELIHANRFKQLYTKCSNCGTEVSFDHVDLDSGLAACYNCKQFFSVEDQAVNKAVKQNNEEVLLATPEGVDIIESNESLDIRYSKFKTASKPKLFFLTFFNIIWNGSMIFMVKQILASGALVPLAFMSLHFIAGIVLFIWLASLFLNHVDIIIDQDAILVKTRPLYNPFKGDIQIYPKDIKQLYVEKYVSSRSNGRTNYAYKLIAILNSNQNLTIIQDSSRRLCLYLEQRIENRLGIEDRHVKGQEG